LKRAVAVTGMGVLCALGDGVEAFWEGLLGGRSAVSALSRFPSGDLRSDVVVESAPFHEEAPEGTGLVDRMALHAARETLRNAGLAKFPPGCGVAIGTGVSGLPESEEAYLFHLDGGSAVPTARVFTRHLPATMADVLAERFGATGPLLSVVNACSSSTVALGQAASWIRSGEAECVLAGSSDALSRLTVGGFNIMRLVSRDRPRPFDANRSGMVIGEAAGFVFLESEESARLRGVPILAFLEGFGMSADGYHATAPQPEGRGAIRCMCSAIDDAGIGPGDIDHINAHGTGTRANDKAEGAAIVSFLGDRLQEVPVSSIKGAVGHCLGAAGVVEAVASVLSLVHQTVPPCAGFETPDPEIPLRVPTRAEKRPLRHLLSLNLAFGGNNASLVFGRAT